MGYIPPGPQTPFSKDRSYGQQPGFVSRHSGKIFLILAVAMIIGVTLVVIATLNAANDDDDNRTEQTSFMLKRDLEESQTFTL